VPNANAPFGLKPVRHAASAPYNDGADLYYVDPSNTQILAIGDPVVLSGSADVNGIPGIVRATAGAGNPITGVIVGFRPTPIIVATGYLPASTAGYAIVEHDPAGLYEIQADGIINPADIGLNANLTAGAPNVAFKKSTFQLNAASKATTATLQLRIRSFVQRPDNDPTSTNANLLVSINLPTETGAAGSTGL
jgi:hypothetical protein